MNRTPVERALAEARNANAIQRQAVIILDRPAPKSEAQQADHEQTIADLIQKVRHRRRMQP